MSHTLVAEPKTASAPGFTSSTPVCVRSRNLHPQELETSSRAVSYMVQRSAKKADLPHGHFEPMGHTPISPLGSARPLLNGGQHPRNEQFQAIISPSARKAPALGSPIRVVPPPSRSRPSEAPTHPQSDRSVQRAPPMDAPVMQRHFSAPASTTLESNGRTSHQFLYYHQMPGPDRHGPPIAWNTREVVTRSPPLPRQRSAKACKKCRRRKTKCSGELPCTRCKNRGLDCEYDEKTSQVRGPTKATISSRKSPRRLFTGSDILSLKDTPSRSRGMYRHQPYPPTRSPIRPVHGMPAMVKAHSAPESNLPVSMSMSQQFLAQSFNMQRHFPHPAQQQMGMDASYIPYVLNGPPFSSMRPMLLHPGMEMSSMVEGYRVPWNLPVDSVTGSVWGWNSTVNLDGRAAADTPSALDSRPTSSCSGHSSSSSDKASSAGEQSKPIARPADVADVFSPASGSSPLSISSSVSSSSLKDALLEKPRVDGQSPQLPRPMSLITEVNGAQVLELHDVSQPPTLFISPSTQRVASILDDVFSASMDPSSSSFAGMSHFSPSSSGNLKFEDFFNLSPDAKRMFSPHAGISLSPEGTMGARGSGSVHDSLACLANYGSGSSLDVTKTPRVQHTSPFDSLTNIMSPSLPLAASVAASDMVAVA